MHRLAATIMVLAVWFSPSAMAQTRNTTSTNKVKSFDHLVINVSDMERALAFYKRLGFTLINEGKHLPKLLINRAAENNSMMQRDDEHLLDLAANRVRSLSHVTN